MSYILEALKKSEQERRRSQVPDLQTEHTPPPERGKGRRLWPFLILAALLLNAALFSWWLRPWSAPEPLVHELSASDEFVASEPPAASPEPAEPSPPSRVAENTTSATPDTKAPSPPASSPQPSPPISPSRPVGEQTAKAEIVPSLPRMEELPHSLRRELPEIAISLHFYTESPTARMVRINGRNLREKQRIDENLTLQEITSDGVILNFNGQAFTFKNL